MKRLVLLFVLLAFGICKANAQGFDAYGENFALTKAIPASELNETMAQTTVQVQGEVLDVCQVAGCWMKIKTVDGKTMRVTFKDYGFFVPTDLSGSSVVFQGVPTLSITSVADLKHYAEDAGKSEAEIEAIKEPIRELTFVADGVLVPKSRN